MLPRRTPANYKSASRIPSISSAASVANRNVAVNVPRRSLALMDASVSLDNPDARQD
jgi:hypothetical protein